MLLHYLVHVSLRLSKDHSIALIYLVHVRPRLSKSLASQSTQNDTVSAIVVLRDSERPELQSSERESFL